MVFDSLKENLQLLNIQKNSGDPIKNTVEEENSSLRRNKPFNRTTMFRDGKTRNVDAYKRKNDLSFPERTRLLLFIYNLPLGYNPQ